MLIRLRAPRDFAGILAVLFAVGIGTVVAAMPASAAAAVRCGDVLATSKVLKRDLRCDTSSTDAALTIEGDGVTLDLNGHEVKGRGRGTGILIRQRSGVKVLGGGVQNFAVPILVTASTQTSLSDLSVKGGDEYGVLINTANETTLKKSVIADSERNVGVDGISNDNTILRNRIVGGDLGVAVRDGNRTVVASNSINQPNDAAIEVSIPQGPAFGTQLQRNVISRSEGTGIVARPQPQLDIGENLISESDDIGLEIREGGGDVDVHDNVVEDSGYAGIMFGSNVPTSSEGSFLRRNTVKRSGHDGLFVLDIDVGVFENTALSNGRLGINSSSSYGSGNVAQRNGDPRECMPATLCE